MSRSTNRVLKLAAVAALCGFALQSGAAESALPAGYARVEYIQSSAKQHIDTGHHFYIGQTFEIVYADSSTAANSENKGYGAGNDNAHTITCGGRRNSNVIGPYLYNGNRTYLPGVLWEVAAAFKYKEVLKIGAMTTENELINLDNGTVDRIDPVTTPPNFDSENSIWLFAQHNAKYPNPGNKRIYSVKLATEEDVLLDLVPAVRLLDMKPGFVDLAHPDDFLTNEVQNVADFTYGLDLTVELPKGVRIGAAGEAAEPKPVVTGLDGAAMTEGVDYELAYADNTAPGTATLTLTRRGGPFDGESRTYSFEVRIAPEPLAKVPEGYTQVAYLQSGNGQYFIMDDHIRYDNEFEIVWQNAGTKSSNENKGYGGGNDLNHAIAGGGRISGGSIYSYYYGGNPAYVPALSVDAVGSFRFRDYLVVGKYTYVYTDNLDTGERYVENSSATRDGASYDMGTGVGIFRDALTTYGDGYPGNKRIYSVRLTTRGVPLASLVPAVHDEGEGVFKPGMYDLVNRKFYTNQNDASPDFLYGSDCEVAPIPVQEIAPGEAAEPKPTVTFLDGTAMTEGVDYELAYANNTASGTATLTLTRKSGPFKDVGRDIPFRVQVTKRALDHVPAGYTQVEYIESGDSQYVDLGRHFLFGQRFEIVYATVGEPTSKENKGYGAGVDLQHCITGGGRFGESQEIAMVPYFYNDNRRIQPWCFTAYHMGDRFRDELTIGYTTQMTITDLDNGISWETPAVATTDAEGYDSGNNIWIFADDSVQWSYPGHKRIYSVRLEQDGYPLRILVPAVRDADAKPGFYDLFEQEFLTNAATARAEFTYGGDFIVEGLGPVWLKNGVATPKPVLRSLDDGRVLAEGTDYVLACADNTEVGTGTLFVTRKTGALAERTFAYEFQVRPARKRVKAPVSKVEKLWYVTDGLVAHWDYLDNTGTGAHDATMLNDWVDLVGGKTMHMSNASGYFTDLEDSFYVGNSSSYVQPTAELAGATSWTNLTVEFRAKCLDNQHSKEPKDKRGLGGAGIISHTYHYQNGLCCVLLSSLTGGAFYRYYLTPQVMGTRSVVYQRSERLAAGQPQYYYEGEPRIPDADENGNQNDKWAGSDSAWMFPDTYYQSFRVYNRALSADEVEYNAMIDRWRFNHDEDALEWLRKQKYVGGVGSMLLVR